MNYTEPLSNMLIADTIQKSGFEFKNLNPLISKKARQYYFDQLC